MSAAAYQGAAQASLRRLLEGAAEADEAGEAGEATAEADVGEAAAEAEEAGEAGEA